jgi:acetyl-CoA acetyltransferase
MRWFADTGVSPDTQKAVAMASYHHAQSNPRAVMHGKPLTEEKYDQARWIAEPFHLYDCCQESDCAAAVIVTSAERAADLRQRPAYIVAAAQGCGYRAEGTESMILHNSPDYGSANYTTVAARLYESAGVRPEDIDVVQAYENFTGGVVMALVEHGFATTENADKVLSLDNLIAPHGGLPLNTSGGNLAEAYVHGMGQHVEAVRQLRGQSCNQVHDAKLSLVAAGPLVVPATTILYGADDRRD